MHPWETGRPPDEECELTVRCGKSFLVKGNADRGYSPVRSKQVQLPAYHVGFDLRLFVLQAQLLAQEKWLNHDWLMEGEEA